MKKCLIAILITVMIALPSVTWASYWNEGNYGYDDAHAFIIDSVADFIELRDRVNSGIEPGNFYYKLNIRSKTINLATSEYEEWISIGTPDNPFTGHFNGNGHTIKVNMVTSLYKHFGCIGLFGYIETRDSYAIKNLTVNGSVRTSWGYNSAAGIAAVLYNASIENCTFTGQVSSYNGDPRQIAYVGGIVEHMYSGTVKNCTVTEATITAAGSWASGYSYAGGIVCRLESGIVEGCTIKESTVHGTWGYSDGASNAFQTVCCGGIVSLVVQNKYSKIIRNNEAYANITGEVYYNDKYLGGIIGKVEDPSLLSENNVYAGASWGIGYDDGGGEGDEPGCINASKLRLTITKTSLSSGTVNTPYNDILTANVTGVNWNVTWSSDNLPSWLRLNTLTGELSGTPTAANTYRFNATAVLGANEVRKVSQQYEITIASAQPTYSLTITNDTSLADGISGTDYSAALKAEVFGMDVSSSAVWSSSNLPSWLKLDSSTGILTGKPTEAKSYKFTVTAVWGQISGSKEFTLTVSASGSNSDPNAAPEVDETVKPAFKTITLMLEGQIGVNFYAYLPEIAGVTYTDKNCWTTFNVRGDTAHNPQTLDETFRSSKGYYGFKCYINAAQMADTITATLHYGNGQTVTKEYSAKKYLDTALGLSSFTQTEHNLMAAIKNFGHYVQPMLSKQNGWTIGDLYLLMDAHSELTDNDIDAAQEAVKTFALVKTLRGSGVEKISYSLVLGSETTIKLYITKAQGYSGSIAAYVDGGTANRAVLENGRYCVQISDIAAKDLGDMHTVRIVADTESNVHVSALSYANTVFNADIANIGNVDIETMKKAVTALYQYYKAAKAYFDSK